MTEKLICLLRFDKKDGQKSIYRVYKNIDIFLDGQTKIHNVNR